MSEHTIVRGEVWLTDLEAGRKAEQSRVRLALVISATEMNATASGLITVLPVTTRELHIPAHIKLEPPEGGVLKTSFIVCDNIHTIARDRLSKKLGVISYATMQRVESMLSMILGFSLSS
jgi:Growth inhibitor